MSPPSTGTDGQNTEPNASLKPWSTGRVLSSAQRERKRLMNRASQSRRRKNLKNTLNAVESRLWQIERRCLAYLPSSSSSSVSGEYTFNDCINATTRASADEGTSLRDLLNDLLGSIYHINPVQVCANEQFNQDAVIRGVILGWDDLQKREFVCPIWNILRRMDALLMMHASVPTRLALLRGIHMMLLGRRLSDRPPPLPPWFKPSKYHSYSSGNIVNDYFAWPRFRQKLITSNNPPLTNRFWFYFTRNVQFECDLSPAHTIDIDPDTGKYRLTMIFRNVTDEIRRYTMGSEFFEAYPECFEDVYECVAE